MAEAEQLLEVKEHELPQQKKDAELTLQLHQELEMAAKQMAHKQLAEAGQLLVDKLQERKG